MRTVQMTLDDDLLEAVDRAVEESGTTRSAFIRQALRAALEQIRVHRLERKQRAGYERNPVVETELSAWEDEQAWPD